MRTHCHRANKLMTLSELVGAGPTSRCSELEGAQTMSHETGPRPLLENADASITQLVIKFFRLVNSCRATRATFRSSNYLPRLIHYGCTHVTLSSAFFTRVSDPVSLKMSLIVRAQRVGSATYFQGRRK
jgi:hypothetical protein